MAEVILPIIWGHGEKGYPNQSDEKAQITDNNNAYLTSLGGMGLPVRFGLRHALFPLPGNGTGKPYLAIETEGF